MLSSPDPMHLSCPVLAFLECQESKRRRLLYEMMPNLSLDDEDGGQASAAPPGGGAVPGAGNKFGQGSDMRVPTRRLKAFLQSLGDVLGVLMVVFELSARYGLKVQYDEATIGEIVDTYKQFKAMLEAQADQEIMSMSGVAVNRIMVMGRNLKKVGPGLFQIPRPIQQIMQQNRINIPDVSERLVELGTWIDHLTQSWKKAARGESHDYPAEFNGRIWADRAGWHADLDVEGRGALGSGMFLDVEAGANGTLYITDPGGKESGYRYAIEGGITQKPWTRFVNNVKEDLADGSEPAHFDQMKKWKVFPLIAGNAQSAPAAPAPMARPAPSPAAPPAARPVPAAPVAAAPASAAEQVVGGLSLTDAKKRLVAAGITDPNMQAQILRGKGFKV